MLVTALDTPHCSEKPRSTMETITICTLFKPFFVVGIIVKVILLFVNYNLVQYPLVISIGSLEVKLFHHHHHHHHLLAFSVETNFKGYSKLLGEETSRNHQAYRRGHLLPRHHNTIRDCAIIIRRGR